MINLIGEINILDALILVAVAGYVWQQQRKQKQAEARKSLTRKLTLKEKLYHKRKINKLNNINGSE
jgi:uncharacterized protein HemX